MEFLLNHIAEIVSAVIAIVSFTMGLISAIKAKNKDAIYKLLMDATKEAIILAEKVQNADEGTKKQVALDYVKQIFEQNKKKYDESQASYLLEEMMDVAKAVNGEISKIRNQYQITVKGKPIGLPLIVSV